MTKTLEMQGKQCSFFIVCKQNKKQNKNKIKTTEKHSNNKTNIKT